MSVMPNSSTPTVTFWGAARTVTGSMHLLEANGRRVLLDCGLYQGKRAEAHERNSNFPFKPSQIDAVILSHAHMDHVGNLPNLVRQGFNGPIYSTPATRDLAAIMLLDSAKIQEEDAEYLNRHRSKGEAKIQPLYERGDVIRTMRCFVNVPYDRPFDLEKGMQLRFVDAGHLLGSAMVSLTLRGNGRDRHLTFTGDLGRRNLPILRDPSPVPPAADLLISESTYGGRTHPPVEQLNDSMADVVCCTIERGGKVLIPAFSLGRTQSVLLCLHELMGCSKVAEVPIFVDSPLAANATEVFRLHPECFDKETADLLADSPDLFSGKYVRYVQSVEESKQLNSRTEPCIIIAASGMCENGRIVHHLKHNIEDPRNTVAIIGFQAPETLGRRIVEKRPEVRIHGRFWKLRAEVVVMNGFSSHADQKDFHDYLGPLAKQTAHVRLVHGDVDQAEALAKSLNSYGFRDVAIPDRGQSVELI
jgi:metallo-beta-lactamase family protein